MKRSVRRIVIFAACFILILGGYFAYRLVLAKRVSVPQDFSEARSRGAVIAQDIVNAANALGTEIKNINDLDAAGKYKEAIQKTDDVLAQVRNIRTHALDLAKELEAMTRAAPAIASEEARNEALASVQARLSLVNHLIAYTDDVSQFAAALQLHLQGARNPDTIATIVKKINAEVAEINNFNSQAGQAMDRFDQLIR